MPFKLITCTLMQTLIPGYQPSPPKPPLKAHAKSIDKGEIKYILYPAINSLGISRAPTPLHVPIEIPMSIPMEIPLPARAPRERSAYDAGTARGKAMRALPMPRDVGEAMEREAAEADAEAEVRRSGRSSRSSSIVAVTKRPVRRVRDDVAFQFGPSQRRRSMDVLEPFRRWFDAQRQRTGDDDDREGEESSAVDDLVLNLFLADQDTQSGSSWETVEDEDEVPDLDWSSGSGSVLSISDGERTPPRLSTPDQELHTWLFYGGADAMEEASLRRKHSNLQHTFRDSSSTSDVSSDCSFVTASEGRTTVQTGCLGSPPRNDSVVSSATAGYHVPPQPLRRRNSRTPLWKKLGRHPRRTALPSIPEDARSHEGVPKSERTQARDVEVVPRQCVMAGEMSRHQRAQAVRRAEERALSRQSSVNISDHSSIGAQDEDRGHRQQQQSETVSVEEIVREVSAMLSESTSSDLPPLESMEAFLDGPDAVDPEDEWDMRPSSRQHTRGTREAWWR